MPGNSHNDFFKSKDTPNTPSWSSTYMLCCGCPELEIINFGDESQVQHMTDTILGKVKRSTSA